MKNRSRLAQSIWLMAALALLVALLPAHLAFASDSDGHFDLKFTGVIHSIDPDQWVVAGQTLIITDRTMVRRAGGSLEPGQWADVMARPQEGGSWLALWVTVRPPEARLKGVVSERPVDGIGLWTIAGQSILVTEETRISERLGPAEVDHWVEVYYRQQADGTLLALRIRGAEPRQLVHVYGAIQAAGDTGWTLSGIPLAVDAATLIARDPIIDVVAHAEATLREDGTLLALHLHPVWIEPGGLRPEVAFIGVVEELPDEGLVGDWLVDDTAVVVTPATVINQTKGLVELGAAVHVLGWQEGDQVVAIRISVVRPAEGGQVGPFRHFRGPIEAMPPRGLYGQWTVGGQQVQVMQQTRIEGAEHAQIGAPAEVGAVQRRNGEMFALWLRIRPVPDAMDVMVK